jgi:hypothetical protein
VDLPRSQSMKMVPQTSLGLGTAAGDASERVMDGGGRRDVEIRGGGGRHDAESGLRGVRTVRF